MTEIVGTPGVIKLLNKDIIEGIIRSNGPITKPEIAKKTNLSVVTVNKIVSVLLLEGKITATGITESTGGRRAQSFEINYESKYYIGLYYDKDCFIGAVSNAVGELVYEKNFPIHTSSYESVMEDTFAAINHLIEQHKDQEIKVICIGVPGVVTRSKVTNIPNIPGWEGKDIVSILQKEYNLPVIMENDINLTTMGLYHMKYQENKVSNMALLYLDQGIGAGFIINKGLFKGATNFAGELSYLPVHNYFKENDQQTKYKGEFERQIYLINQKLGTTQDQQREYYKQILINTITDGIMGLICILNPEVIVLKHNYLTARDIGIIKERLSHHIDEVNIPEIVIADELKSNSIHGVMRMCIRESTPTYSLSNKKRG